MQRRHWILVFTLGLALGALTAEHAWASCAPWGETLELTPMSVAVDGVEMTDLSPYDGFTVQVGSEFGARAGIYVRGTGGTSFAQEFEAR